MEILTTSATVYGNAYSGLQTAVDIKQIIANTGLDQPAAGGSSPNPASVQKPADWAKLAADQAAPVTTARDLPRDEHIGRKKKQPRLDGETGHSFTSVIPMDDAAAPREGKPASRTDRRQNISARGEGREVLRPFSETDGRGRVKAAVTPATPVAKAVDPALADMPNIAAPGISVGDKDLINDLASAVVPMNSRPAGEFLPAQSKAPDPLLNERQPTVPHFPSEMKSHGGNRGGTLLFTFNKGKTVSSDPMAFNQVQIAFQGSTVLTPSNRTTQENLLANQSEARGYLVKPASDREQQQRHQDSESGEDQ